MPVYSTSAGAVFLLTGRPTSAVPTSHDRLSGRRNQAYGAERDALRHDVRSRHGVVVYLVPVDERSDLLASVEDLVGNAGLEQAAADEVAVAYRCRPSSPSCA